MEAELAALQEHHATQLAHSDYFQSDSPQNMGANEPQSEQRNAELAEQVGTSPKSIWLV